MPKNGYSVGWIAGEREWEMLKGPWSMVNGGMGERRVEGYAGRSTMRVISDGQLKRTA